MVDPERKEPVKQPPTSVEEEFSALGMMVEAMKKLDRDAQARVLRYLKERFGVYVGD